MDAAVIATTAAAAIGVIAGVVQVIDYLEKKKRERGGGGSYFPPVTPPPTTASQAEPQRQELISKPLSSNGVVLLYKRGPEDDLYVLGLLERELKLAGYDVFVDRHLQIGVAWAAEIERQIAAAKAVVVLLSAASVTSEMVEYEVESAHRAAQTGGHPRILSVRVGYDAPLVGTLGTILSPLQHALWNSKEDDDRLCQVIIQALVGKQVQNLEEIRHEPVGGAVPLDSRFYVVRPSDALFLEAIRRRDSLVLVKGARQIGKTSLLARGISAARQTGARIVLTDLQTLNNRDLESAVALYQAFGEQIADQLDLDGVNVRKSWDPERGANSNLERFLRRDVLGQIEGSIVWGLDEIDRVFGCPFSSEVFGLFRSWHNRRSIDPETPWTRLTLAMAYATEAHLFIQDLNQSPFNVGTRLTLDDLTREQAADLNRRYGSPLDPGGAQFDQFIEMVGGQPYLVRQGLSFLSAGDSSFNDFAKSAASDDGQFGDHLRRILITLSLDQKLWNVVQAMLNSDRQMDDESFYRLRTAGIISGSSAADCGFRCGLYKTYLTRHI